MSTWLSLSDQTKDITKTRIYDNDLLLGFRLAANQATMVKAMTRLLWEAICEPVSPWETPQVSGSQEISRLHNSHFPEDVNRARLSDSKTSKGAPSII